MSPFSFADQYTFAETRCVGIDTAAIKGMIPGCTRVLRAPEGWDRKGIDYFAELESGVRLGIDAKARSAGCSRFWGVTREGQSEPDLQLETWSVMPSDASEGRVGWTLDTAKLTDLVLYTFDPADCDRCYLIGFPHLRAALVRYEVRWGLDYRVARQHSVEADREWWSECMFVPVTVVQRAIQEVSIGKPSVLLPAQAPEAA